MEDIFVQIIMIGIVSGTIDPDDIKVSLDGSKVRANASAKLTKDEKGLNELSKQVKEEINILFDKVKKIDEDDENNAKNKIMKKIKTKESNLESITDAIKTLKKQKEESIKKIKKEKNREPTEKEGKKIEDMKINITDQDAKYMKERCGIIKPNYNVQISVDEKNMFIVTRDVVTECNDQHQLIPMVKKTEETMGTHPVMLKGDNGYFPQLTEAVKAFPNTVFYIDDRNRRKDVVDLNEIKKKYDDTQYKNLERLLTEEGNNEYKKRMHTVEPVFGWIKYNTGYKHFLVRGIDKVKGEFNLMCIGYNIMKLKNFLKKKRINTSEFNEMIKSMKNTRVNTA